MVHGEMARLKEQERKLEIDSTSTLCMVKMTAHIGQTQTFKK